MNDLLERAAFEAWYTDGGTSPRAVEKATDGTYKYIAANNLWAAWQEATRIEREACAKLVEGYMRETGEMVARGCLVSVAHDIRARSNERK